nr:hypothetical protein [Tanacetum cinerariifolium]
MTPPATTESTPTITSSPSPATTRIAPRGAFEFGFNSSRSIWVSKNTLRFRYKSAFGLAAVRSAFGWLCNSRKGERAQQEEEANIALIESWDDVQAKIDANYQLAERLRAEEQQ